MSLCNDCKRRHDCMDRDKMDMTEGCGDYKPALAPDPRDRELEILRAQVRVLCSELAEAAADVGWPDGGRKALHWSDTDEIIELWINDSRRQAEKEVGGESKT